MSPNQDPQTYTHEVIPNINHEYQTSQIPEGLTLPLTEKNEGSQQRTDDAPDIGSVVLAQSSVQETLRNERAAELFKPFEGLVQETHEEADDHEFDHLFMNDEDYTLWKADHPANEQVGMKSEKEGLIQPSKEDLAAAKVNLFTATQADDNFASIIKKYHGTGAPAESVIEMLQKDGPLRIELGTYLLDKMDKIETLVKMPRRIAVNRQKNSNLDKYNSYGAMTSREYACMLALAMVDGSFNTSDSAVDMADYDEITRPDGVGQHRTAAKLLLSIPYKENTSMSAWDDLEELSRRR